MGRPGEVADTGWDTGTRGTAPGPSGRLMADADLSEYRGRRDFQATPEPAPGAEPEPSGGAPRFVVQRHDARALHFDLRLEVDGALASWAVPKGPPLREGVRRLAVRTEDHPLEYLTFAAVIPQAQYGAGRMSVWDAGTFGQELWTDDEIKLVLEGGILRGHYHLVRTGERSGKQEWLIFRSSKGPAGPADPGVRFRSMRPMLASTADAPFDDPAWAFELKWDGYRALALVTSDGTDLRSRNGQDLTPQVRRPRRPAPADHVPGGGAGRRGGGARRRRDARTSARWRRGGDRSPTWPSTCCTSTGSGSRTCPGASGAPAWPT